jgi:hypothetical protein
MLSLLSKTIVLIKFSEVSPTQCEPAISVKEIEKLYDAKQKDN